MTRFPTQCAWAAAHTRNSYLCAVLAAGPANRREGGRQRRRPVHPGQLLTPAHRRPRPRRPRRGLLHPPQPRPPTRPTHPPARPPRLPRSSLRSTPV